MLSTLYLGSSLAYAMDAIGNGFNPLPHLLYLHTAASNLLLQLMTASADSCKFSMVCQALLANVGHDLKENLHQGMLIQSD